MTTIKVYISTLTSFINDLQKASLSNDRLDSLNKVNDLLLSIKNDYSSPSLFLGHRVVCNIILRVLEYYVKDEFRKKAPTTQARTASFQKCVTEPFLNLIKITHTGLPSSSDHLPLLHRSGEPLNLLFIHLFHTLSNFFGQYWWSDYAKILLFLLDFDCYFNCLSPFFQSHLSHLLESILSFFSETNNEKDFIGHARLLPKLFAHPQFLPSTEFIRRFISIVGAHHRRFSETDGLFSLENYHPWLVKALSSLFQRNQYNLENNVKEECIQLVKYFFSLWRRVQLDPWRLEVIDFSFLLTGHIYSKYFSFLDSGAAIIEKLPHEDFIVDIIFPRLISALNANDSNDFFRIELRDYESRLTSFFEFSSSVIYLASIIDHKAMDSVIVSLHNAFNGSRYSLPSWLNVLSYPISVKRITSEQAKFLMNIYLKTLQDNHITHLGLLFTSIAALAPQCTSDELLDSLNILLPRITKMDCFENPVPEGYRSLVSILHVLRSRGICHLNLNDNICIDGVINNCGFDLTLAEFIVIGSSFSLSVVDKPDDAGSFVSRKRKRDEESLTLETRVHQTKYSPSSGKLIDSTFAVSFLMRFLGSLPIIDRKQSLKFKVSNVNRSFFSSILDSHNSKVLIEKIDHGNSTNYGFFGIDLPAVIDLLNELGLMLAWQAQLSSVGGCKLLDSYHSYFSLKSSRVLKLLPETARFLQQHMKGKNAVDDFCFSAYGSYQVPDIIQESILPFTLLLCDSASFGSIDFIQLSLGHCFVNVLHSDVLKLYTLLYSKDDVSYEEICTILLTLRVLFTWSALGAWSPTSDDDDINVLTSVSIFSLDLAKLALLRQRLSPTGSLTLSIILFIRLLSKKLNEYPKELPRDEDSFYKALKGMASIMLSLRLLSSYAKEILRDEYNTLSFNYRSFIFAINEWAIKTVFRLVNQLINQTNYFMRQLFSSTIFQSVETYPSLAFLLSCISDACCYIKNFLDYSHSLTKEDVDTIAYTYDTIGIKITSLSEGVKELFSHASLFLSEPSSHPNGFLLLLVQPFFFLYSSLARFEKTRVSINKDLQTIIDTLLAQHYLSKSTTILNLLSTLALENSHDHEIIQWCAERTKDFTTNGLFLSVQNDAVLCHLAKTQSLILEKSDGKAWAVSLGRSLFSSTTENVSFLARLFSSTCATAPFLVFKKRLTVLKDFLFHFYSLLKNTKNFYKVVPLLLTFAMTCNAAPDTTGTIVSHLLIFYATDNFEFGKVILDTMTFIYQSSGRTEVTLKQYAALCFEFIDQICFEWIYHERYSLDAFPSLCFDIETPEEFIIRHISHILPLAILTRTSSQNLNKICSVFSNNHNLNGLLEQNFVPVLSCLLLHSCNKSDASLSDAACNSIDWVRTQMGDTFLILCKKNYIMIFLEMLLKCRTGLITASKTTFVVPPYASLDTVIVAAQKLCSSSYSDMKFDLLFDGNNGANSYHIIRTLLSSILDSAFSYQYERATVLKEIAVGYFNQRSLSNSLVLEALLSASCALARRKHLRSIACSILTHVWRLMADTTPELLKPFFQLVCSSLVPYLNGNKEVEVLLDYIRKNKLPVGLENDIPSYDENDSTHTVGTDLILLVDSINTLNSTLSQSSASVTASFFLDLVKKISENPHIIISEITNEVKERIRWKNLTGINSDTLTQYTNDANRHGSIIALLKESFRRLLQFSTQDNNSMEARLASFEVIKTFVMCFAKGGILYELDFCEVQGEDDIAYLAVLFSGSDDICSLIISIYELVLKKIRSLCFSGDSKLMSLASYALSDLMNNYDNSLISMAFKGLGNNADFQCLSFFIASNKVSDISVPKLDDDELWDLPKDDPNLFICYLTSRIGLLCEEHRLGCFRFLKPLIHLTAEYAPFSEFVFPLFLLHYSMIEGRHNRSLGLKLDELLLRSELHPKVSRTILYGLNFVRAARMTAKRSFNEKERQRKLNCGILTKLDRIHDYWWFNDIQPATLIKAAQACGEWSLCYMLIEMSYENISPNFKGIAFSQPSHDNSFFFSKNKHALSLELEPLRKHNEKVKDTFLQCGQILRDFGLVAAITNQSYFNEPIRFNEFSLFLQASDSSLRLGYEALSKIGCWNMSKAVANGSNFTSLGAEASWRASQWDSDIPLSSFLAASNASSCIHPLIFTALRSLSKKDSFLAATSVADGKNNLIHSLNGYNYVELALYLQGLEDILHTCRNLNDTPSWLLKDNKVASFWSIEREMLGLRAHSYLVREPLDFIRYSICKILDRPELLSEHLIQCSHRACEGEYPYTIYRAMSDFCSTCKSPALLQDAKYAVSFARILDAVGDSNRAVHVLSSSTNLTKGSDEGMRLLMTLSAKVKRFPIVSIVENETLRHYLSGNPAHISGSFYTFALLLEILLDNIEQGYSDIAQHRDQLRKDMEAYKKLKHFNRDATSMRKLNEKENEEWERTESQYDSYRATAIFAYCKHLSISSTPQDVHGMYRLIRLWFNDEESPLPKSTQPEKDAASFSFLPHIPAYKFLPVFNQLLVRTGSDSLNDKTVRRVVKEYPHHTLWQVFSLLNDRKEENNQRTLFLNGLLQDINSRLIEQMRIATEVYIELSNREPKESAIDISDLKQKIGGKCIDVAVPTIPLRTVKGIKLECIQEWGSEVRLLGGLSQPKSISCITTSGLVAPQIVKSGDDPRVDMLIEQVFTLVNTLFSTRSSFGADERSLLPFKAMSPSSIVYGKNNWELTLRTYIITPLSSNSGIIQNVIKTVSLRDYLLSERGAHRRYFPNDLTHDECFTRLASIKSNKLSELLDIFKNFTPAMHYFFYEYCGTSKRWLEMKKQYTISAACNSISGFVVGLGDRHNGNILLDTASGEMVHIDHGMAFDYAAGLKVPEKVPFRLTRDIVDGLGVLGVEGNFRLLSQESLTVCRNNRELLLTALRVLLQDPVGHWAKASASPDGYIKRAIQRIKNRLNGLEDGEQLHIEGHVHKLITTATNPAFLAEMFAGWAPWA